MSEFMILRDGEFLTFMKPRTAYVLQKGFLTAFDQHGIPILNSVLIEERDPGYEKTWIYQYLGINTNGERKG